jgi:hypothetical protein
MDMDMDRMFKLIGPVYVDRLMHNDVKDAELLNRIPEEQLEVVFKVK